ncbi:MAG: PIN domain-containing protein [Alphaproteobacteria bacterium]|nr:PIN domain-containing protein [Alphaproteobacteria bacterium]
MSGKAFFDTNVLVYATAEHDARWPMATALLAGGGAISTQVLNEFASVARRKLKWSWPEIRDGLAGFQILCPNPLPLTVATHDAALVIAERDGVAFYDALIVASALEAGCSTLFTEDMQDGRRIAGRLTIRNPFV